MTRGTGRTAIGLLAAEAPEPARADELALFGQFVGDWEFTGVEHHDDGSRVTTAGEIHFSWILQGRAVQDVWIERERGDDLPKTYGSTIRMYDPKAGAWRITWTEPLRGDMRSLAGGKRGDEIVLEGNGSSGAPIRWIFSDIRPDRFQWRAERCTAAEWTVVERLDVRRLDGDAR
jgi:hypothetical protein